MTDRPGKRAVDEHLREELVRFVRALRRGGASVLANAATTGARSLVEVGLGDRTRVRTALRASLITDSDDFETFDRLFETFWGRLTGLTGTSESLEEDELDGGFAPLDDPATERPDDRSDDRDDAERDPQDSFAESFATAVGDSSTADDDDDGNDGDDAETALYSPSGSATPVDGSPRFAVDDLEAEFRELTRTLAGLRGRRFRPGAAHADVRRALRASVSTGGTVLSVPEKERQRSAVRALVLVDVSRSVLDTVDRGFLIDFLRQACRDWRDVRVFFFDEDLREVTEAIDAPSATAAMAALEAAETAWGGGTRIGDSLARLAEIAPDAVDRRTVVFVVSDGLEMGDVSVLEREFASIARRARRVLWLNPLASADEYEPTARGMAAALPRVDGLFAFTESSDVAELARQLRRQGPGGRIGYEFDSRASSGANRKVAHET